MILVSLSVSLAAAPSLSVERGDWLILFGAGGGGIPYNRMLIFCTFVAVTFVSIKSLFIA